MEAQSSFDLRLQVIASDPQTLPRLDQRLLYKPEAYDRIKRRSLGITEALFPNIRMAESSNLVVSVCYHDSRLFVLFREPNWDILASLPLVEGPRRSAEPVSEIALWLIADMTKDSALARRWRWVGQDPRDAETLARGILEYALGLQVRSIRVEDGGSGLVKFRVTAWDERIDRATAAVSGNVLQVQLKLKSARGPGHPRAQEALDLTQSLTLPFWPPNSRKARSGAAP